MIRCCNYCMFRFPGCHDICSDYKEEKDEYEARKHIFREKNPIEVLEYSSAKFSKSRPNGRKSRRKK